MRERRRKQRYDLSGWVVLSMGDKVFDLPLADISESGVGTLSEMAVLGAKPDGQVGTCRILSDDLACEVKAFVSVMRIRKVGMKHLIGLRFESISDEHLRVVHAFETLARMREEKSRPRGPA